VFTLRERRHDSVGKEMAKNEGSPVETSIYFLTSQIEFWHSFVKTHDSFVSLSIISFILFERHSQRMRLLSLSLSLFDVSSPVVQFSR
jgi:hypothetical protein